MRTRLFLAWIAAPLWCLAHGAPASAGVCGDPPPSVPTQSSDEHRYSGDIEADAKTLASLLGKGQFKAQAEVIRRQIYQDPDKLNASLNDQRLFYSVCSLIERDETQSIQDKVAALRDLRGSLALSVPNRGGSDLPTSRLTYFNLKPNGYAEITPDRSLLRIIGFSTASGRYGIGLGVSLNGQKFSLFPGDHYDVTFSRGVCGLDLVQSDERSGGKFRTDCGVKVSD